MKLSQLVRNSMDSLTIKRRILNVLISLYDYGSIQKAITIDQLSHELMHSKRTIYAYLQELTKEGYLNKIGTTKSSTYVPSYDFILDKFFEINKKIANAIINQIEEYKQLFNLDFLRKVLPTECLNKIEFITLKEFKSKKEAWKFLQYPLKKWLSKPTSKTTFTPYFFSLPFFYIHFLKSFNLELQLNYFLNEIVKVKDSDKFIKFSTIYSYFLLPISLSYEKGELLWELHLY